MLFVKIMERNLVGSESKDISVLHTLVVRSSISSAVKREILSSTTYSDEREIRSKPQIRRQTQRSFIRVSCFWLERIHISCMWLYISSVYIYVCVCMCKTRIMWLRITIYIVRRLYTPWQGNEIIVFVKDEFSSNLSKFLNQ